MDGLMLLGVGKKKPMKGKDMPDEEKSEDSDDPSSAKMQASKDMMQAMKDDDAEAFSTALETFIDECY